MDRPREGGKNLFVNLLSWHSFSGIAGHWEHFLCYYHAQNTECISTDLTNMAEIDPEECCQLLCTVNRVEKLPKTSFEKQFSFKSLSNFLPFSPLSAPSSCHVVFLNPCHKNERKSWCIMRGPPQGFTVVEKFGSHLLLRHEGREAFNL